MIGVTGSLARPLELVLARPDEDGELRRIGLSLPLSPRLRDLAGQFVRSNGMPPERVSTGGFGLPSTEYQPVHPDLVAEVETEASVETFTSRLRPRVHRLPRPHHRGSRIVIKGCPRGNGRTRHGGRPWGR